VPYFVTLVTLSNIPFFLLLSAFFYHVSIYIAIKILGFSVFVEIFSGLLNVHGMPVPSYIMPVPVL